MTKAKTKGPPTRPTADDAENPPRPTGLRCRDCGCRHFRVVSTDPKPNGQIKRTRACRHCGKTVRTTERSDPDPAA